IHAVDGYSFRPHDTRIRREAKNGNNKNKDCPNSVTSDFRCKSGECIKEDQECNGTVNCEDASDETNACHRYKCQDFLFRCKYGACINPELECDGKPDCRDNSDETTTRCKNSTETCKEEEFRCNSGQCINNDWKCDGKKNCEDGSDETSATCWNMRCPGFTYKCKYGACVNGDAECNGVIDCLDGSDEDPSICKATPAPPTPTPAEPKPQPPVLQKGSCILPEHPADGRWSVIGSFQTFSPGTPIGTGTVLQINCNKGFKIDGDELILCEEGTWSANIGQCLKTCPVIHSTPTMKVTCTYKNKVTDNCTDAIDGTLAKFHCATFYEDLGLQNMPVHLCHDGSWNQRRPECVPVCGRKSVTATTLIVNGTNVTQGDYPWQVALYTAQSKVLICGGSMITQRVIITAAHCITDQKGKMLSKDLYMVAVGKYFRPYNDPRDANEAQFSPLQEMFIPRQYKGPTQNYLGDIAILVTIKTFTLSRRVQPVCVDWGSNYASELSNPSRNSYGYVAGWGFTAENENPSEELKELKVPAVTYEQCNQNLPEDYEAFLTDDKLCAGYLDQGTSVCKGDSGGGLVFKHKDRYYITGIVSLSPQAPTGGCNSQQYGLYTSVYRYIEEFILDKVSRFKPQH
ncbi:prolow-density lipoprotein receptor-related protein 1-like, partial [Asbolus verrucosus]